MPGETVLVVIAEKPESYFCAAVLEEEDYHVLSAGSLGQAIEIAKSDLLDILVVSEEMTSGERGDFLDTMRHIQPAIGVVLYRKRHVGAFPEVKAYGADSLLVEPLTRENILASLWEALTNEGRVREKIRLQTLHPLFEMGRTFTSQADLEWALKTMLDSALQETKSQGGAIFLIDDEDKELKLCVECHLVADGRNALSSSIAKLVTSTGEPLAIKGGKQGGPELLLAGTKGSFVSTLCVPLQVGRRAVGALQIYKTTQGKGFMQSDLEMLSIAGGQVGIAIENKRLSTKLGDSYLNVITSLASALEARNHDVQDHCRVLAACSMAAGKALNMRRVDLESLRLGGMFHDIGKIGIPDNILQKPASLTEDEYAVIKKHPEIGVEILKPVEMLREVIPLVRHHHERFDGTGYPDGLKGQAIPIGARILAVADAYTAMTSARPYRTPLTHSAAIQELKANSGTQLDPAIVEAFIRTWPPPAEAKSDGGRPLGHNAAAPLSYQSMN
ncbi:MAG: HD domain-containing phosphohydrolase [Chloroflexota bacterium]